MKLSTLLLAGPLLLTQHTAGLVTEHFTITALGDLVPSGYTGYQYSVRFLIRDRLNSATLTRCGHTWAKQSNFPSNYIPCDDANWRWRYIGKYAECGFTVALAHSKIQSDGTYKYNTTSEATLLSTQVPCAVGASKNFTCIYGASGAQLCGLGKGTILQVPVRKSTSKTSKIIKKAAVKPAKKSFLSISNSARDVKEDEESEDEELISESVVYLDLDSYDGED